MNLKTTSKDVLALAFCSETSFAIYSLIAMSFQEYALSVIFCLFAIYLNTKE